MIETAKSIDWVLNLLSDIVTPPICIYYVTNYTYFHHSVKFGLRPSEAEALPL